MSKLVEPCSCSVSALKLRRAKPTARSPALSASCIGKTVLNGGEAGDEIGSKVRRREPRPGAYFGLHLICCSIGVLSLTFISACASTSEQMQPLSSLQAVQYYPFLVKGYQNTYPKRPVMVLPAVDARDFRDNSGAAHLPENGKPAIGLVRGKSGEIVQRLYGPALEPLVQQSIVQAAQEAGMIASSSDNSLQIALSSRQADYVIVPKIARLWVDKHRGPDNAAGPTWSATAEVALDVVVYKVPFNVPFWQGESEATYDDPPPPVAGAAPEDETEMYDDPGQVLSVGLTRAAAGVFKRDDLHTLITQDSPSTHQ